MKVLPQCFVLPQFVPQFAGQTNVKRVGWGEKGEDAEPGFLRQFGKASVFSLHQVSCQFCHFFGGKVHGGERKTKLLFEETIGKRTRFSVPTRVGSFAQPAFSFAFSVGFAPIQWQVPYLKKKINLQKLIDVMMIQPQGHLFILLDSLLHLLPRMRGIHSPYIVYPRRED